MIIENVGDPIVVCDSNAKIVLLDPLAEQLFVESDFRNGALVKNQAQFDAYIYAFTYSFAVKETGTLRLFNPATKNEVEYDARSGKIYDDRGQVAYTVTVLRDLIGAAPGGAAQARAAHAGSGEVRRRRAIGGDHRA